MRQLECQQWYSKRAHQCVESVRTDQSHSIREDCSTNGVRRAASTSRIHGRFRVLNEETGVELNHIRVIIESTQGVGDVWVGVDVLHCLVSFEAEEVSELIE